MSRKDYVAFAEMFRTLAMNAGSHAEAKVLRKVAGEVTAIFARDNARFDTERFLSACDFERWGE